MIYIGNKAAASDAIVVPAAGIIERPYCSQVLLEIWHHPTAAGSCRLVSATSLHVTTSQLLPIDCQHEQAPEDACKQPQA